MGGLEADMRALRQGNVDVGVLQETKLTYRIHIRQGEGYSICVIEAEIRNQGGISVV